MDCRTFLRLARTPLSVHHNFRFSSQNVASSSSKAMSPPILQS